jgi:hypothetical protein
MRVLSRGSTESAARAVSLYNSGSYNIGVRPPGDPF